MFIKCVYVTLSVVEFPPNVPQPTVIDGTSPVLRPTEPCTPAAFTRRK